MTRKPRGDFTARSLPKLISLAIKDACRLAGFSSTFSTQSFFDIFGLSRNRLAEFRPSLSGGIKYHAIAKMRSCAHPNVFFMMRWPADAQCSLVLERCV